MAVEAAPRVDCFEVRHLESVDRTWADIFGSAASAAGEDACLTCWSSAAAAVDEALSFGDFWRRARRCGAALAPAPGGRVVFLCHPSVAYYVAAAGAFDRACAVVNLNWRQPAAALAHALDALGGCEALVVADPLAGLADAVATDARRFRLGDLPTDGGAALGRGEAPAAAPSPASPADVALVMFTSGSTGRPKGVPMTHRGLLHACRTKLVAHGGVGNVARGTVSFLPNFHVIGFVNNFLFNAYARVPGAVLLEAASALLTVDLLATAIAALLPDSVDTVPAILESVALSLVVIFVEETPAGKVGVHNKKKKKVVCRLREIERELRVEGDPRDVHR